VVLYAARTDYLTLQRSENPHSQEWLCYWNLVCDPRHAQGFLTSHRFRTKSGIVLLAKGNSKRRASWSDKTIFSWRFSCYACFSLRTGEECTTSGIEARQADVPESGEREREPVTCYVSLGKVKSYCR
jgi:hypothetical protein